MKYFYLKVNQHQPFAYRNLQNWINVIAGFENAKMVVLCDKPEIKENITNVCKLTPGIEFISSEREAKELQEICEEITNDRWRMAGYAHLTTFWHAWQQENCEAFWNIDADDTYLCLSEDRTREALLAAEEMALREGMLVYSLDMHTSRGKGEPWSFGITYTDNRTDWITYMRNEVSDPLWKDARKIEAEMLHLLNIDMFFTYIQKKQYARGQKRVIGTFYYDHAWFLHYSVDMLAMASFSDLYQWRNGRIYTPIFSDLLKAGKYVDGQVIPWNVDKIDISITEDESLWGLQKYSFFGPFEKGNRALVDDLPLHETEQWGALNNLLGYHSPEGMEQWDAKPDEWRRMLTTLQDLYSDGEEIYEMLKKSRPEGVEIIVCPGHMGDTLLIASLSEEYKKQHGVGKLIYVSASLPEEMLNLYSSIDAVLMLDKTEMESLRFYIMIRKLWNENGIRYAHFQEEVVMNYPHVSTRGALELDYQNHSFRENRMHMMDLKTDSVFAPLRVHFPDNRKALHEKYQNAVLLMPVSYSAKLLPEIFWENLAIAIQRRGYEVYTNYNGAPEENVIKGTNPLGSSFFEMTQIADVFSLCIGLRSGLCDLIALTEKGRLVVLYAEHEDELDDGIFLRDEEMKESNIYDLGRRDGICCYRYLSKKEDQLINEICKQLPQKKGV